MDKLYGKLFLRDREFPVHLSKAGVWIKVFDDEEPNAWLYLSPHLLGELNKDVNKR